MAKWLEKSEIIKNFSKIKNGEQNGGIPLLYSDNDVYTCSNENHTLIVGSTGSMKSRLIIMPTILNLLKASENIIVTDPKGEILKNTVDIATKYDYNVFVIDFINPSNSNCWNPLSNLNYYLSQNKYNKLSEEIKKFAKKIIGQNEAKDPFWDLSGQVFIEIIMELFYRTTKEKNIIELYNFALYINKYILKLKHNRSLQKEIEQTIYDLTDNKNGIHSQILEELIEKLKVYIDLADNTYTCIYQTADTAFNKFLKCPEILKDTKDKKTVDFNLLLKEKTIIYFILPDFTKEYDLMANLLVTQSYSYIIEKVNNLETLKSPIRINYILDEFANVPPIEDFSKMISISRSRNIRFYLAIQNITQLENNYKDAAETIKSNCNTNIYLYSDDISTHKYFLKFVDEILDCRGLKEISKKNKEALIVMSREKPLITKLKDIDECKEVVLC